MEDKIEFSMMIYSEVEQGKENIKATSKGIMLKPPLEMLGKIYDGKDLNRQGVEIISSVMVQSLSANIHMAHQLGVYDSAAHLRKIISDLEDLFVMTCHVETHRH